MQDVDVDEQLEPFKNGFAQAIVLVHQAEARLDELSVKLDELVCSSGLLQQILREQRQARTQLTRAYGTLRHEQGALRERLRATAQGQAQQVLVAADVALSDGVVRVLEPGAYERANERTTEATAGSDAVQDLEWLATAQSHLQSLLEQARAAAAPAAAAAAPALPAIRDRSRSPPATTEDAARGKGSSSSSRPGQGQQQ